MEKSKFKLKTAHLVFLAVSFATSSQAQSDEDYEENTSTTTGSDSFSTSSTDSVTATSQSTTQSIVEQTAQPTRIIFVTDCSTCSSSSGSSVNNGSTSIPSSVAGSEGSSEKEGALIGGLVGGLVFIVIAIVIYVLGKKRSSKKKNQENLGISSKEFFNKDEEDKYTEEPKDKPIKRYNFSNKQSNDPIISPVVIYSDNLINPEALNNNGARLSKYNFLSRAFSQMRPSSGVYQEPKEPDQPTKDNSPVLSEAQIEPKSEPISLKPRKYQMYSMYNQDSNLELIPPSPAFVHSSHPSLPDPTRESTMTVGTLHAPLFKSQQKTHEKKNSLVSEVSEYSNTNKPYPYF